MKKQLLLILLGLFIVFNSCTDYNKKINLMTYNIRLNTETDSINKWDNRKEGIVSLIKEEDVDILGIQEALPDQIDYLSNQLKDYNINSIGFDIDVELSSILTIKDNHIPQIYIRYKRRTFKEGKKLQISDGWIILVRILKMMRYY